MVKKIMIASFCCHMIVVYAQERKEPATPATPKTPGVAVTGQVPFRFDAPGLEKATAALGREAAESLKNVKLSIDAEALTNAAKALKEIQLTINGAPEITVKSSDLEKVAKAFSANIDHQLQLKVPEQPVLLQVTIPDQTRENLTDTIGDTALKVGAVVGLGCFCHNGGSCCILCPLALMFVTPYRCIRTAVTNSPAIFMALFNSCRNHTNKQPDGHLN